MTTETGEVIVSDTPEPAVEAAIAEDAAPGAEEGEVVDTTERDLVGGEEGVAGSEVAVDDVTGADAAVPVEEEGVSVPVEEPTASEAEVEVERSLPVEEAIPEAAAEADDTVIDTTDRDVAQPEEGVAASEVTDDSVPAPVEEAVVVPVVEETERAIPVEEPVEGVAEEISVPVAGDIPAEEKSVEDDVPAAVSFRSFSIPPSTTHIPCTQKQNITSNSLLLGYFRFQPPSPSKHP